MEQIPTTTTAAPSAFACELRLRVAGATASLTAAEVMEDPLLVQIAGADLADLLALAERNDIAVA